jgi:Protein of unknown function (DUF1800)
MKSVGVRVLVGGSKKLSIIAVSLLLLVFSSPLISEAAPKKKKPKKPVEPITSGITETKVTVKLKINNKKKKVKAKVYCYNKISGKAKKVKGGYTFTSFKILIKKDPSQKALYKALKKVADPICQNPEITTPTPGTTPDFLSMDAYTGTFGEDEAHTLFNRFGFGASPARIQEAVADGLAKTIDKLTTYVEEPHMEAIENSLRCTGLFPGDPRNGTDNYKCDLTNPNDIDMTGLKAGMLYRHLYSQNAFFERLEFFLRDRFQSVNTRVLGGCRRWAVIPYVNLVRKAARTGDFVQYTRDFGNDYFAAIIWLHLLDSTYVGPNEDYAREVLQLGAVGPFNLDGTPVYGDLDVAQAALALTGWIETSYEDTNGHRICVPAFSQGLHSPGPHRLFIGTPYESVIYNLEDILTAVQRHPRMGEYIAEQIYDDFINPYATPDAVRELAKVVRDSNYNMITVMRTVMASKALYAPKSHRSIPKQPLEVLISFMKITGIPWTHDFVHLAYRADNIGQLDLSPNTVFGWRNRDALAGEGYVLSRRNLIIDLINQDRDKLKENKFTFWDAFLQGIPADGTASDQFIARLQSWFNMHLNTNQIANFKEFLDYDRHSCNEYSNCGGGQLTYKIREPFDPAIDSQREGQTSSSDKTRGAIALMAMMPEMMMK